MSSILDNPKEIAELDVRNTAKAIQELGSQVKHVWETTQSIPEVDLSKKIHTIVVAGMGGSALGTHVIQSVFKHELDKPVLICPDYSLPSFVGPDTLVILSSYSGTTEETLSAAQDAVARKAQIAGISAGGQLAEFLQKGKYPSVIFDPIYNYGNPPRMALGYSVFGQIALLTRLGLLKITDQDREDVLAAIAEEHLRSSVTIPESENPAKLLAFQLLGKIPIITVAEHLEGVAHVFANQLNENSKTYSEYRLIPEINHHMMEGLKFPEGRESVLQFLTVHSELYTGQNQKRFSLTEEVITKNGLEYLSLDARGKTRLSQAFQLLTFGSYVSYYLALLHHENPAPNPWVDWFKSELKK